MNTTKFNCIFKNSRFLVNEYTLNFVLNNKNNNFSFLMKSFFVFYYMVFSDKNMFEFVSKCDDDSVPWGENNIDRIKWLPNFIEKEKDILEKEKKQTLWFLLLQQWFLLLFRNSLFHILYSDKDGYGIYARNDIELNNIILNV